MINTRLINYMHSIVFLSNRQSIICIGGIRSQIDAELGADAASRIRRLIPSSSPVGMNTGGEKSLTIEREREKKEDDN